MSRHATGFRPGHLHRHRLIIVIRVMAHPAQPLVIIEYAQSAQPKAESAAGLKPPHALYLLRFLYLFLIPVAKSMFGSMTH